MDLVYANLGTLSGISMLLLTLGLALGLRPWTDHPWLRPWVASFGVNALTLLSLSLPLALPFLPIAPLQTRTFAFLNSGFFLVAGLQAIGWLRLNQRPAPLWLAAIPMALYVLLFFTLVGEKDMRSRVVLFSLLQAGLHAFMAFLAYRGLKRVAPNMGIVATVLLGLHALYYLARAGLALGLPAHGDYSISVALAVMEGLIFSLLLGYLEWLILTEGEA
jgi:hypothetical protein